MVAEKIELGTSAFCPVGGRIFYVVPMALGSSRWIWGCSVVFSVVSVAVPLVSGLSIGL